MEIVMADDEFRARLTQLGVLATENVKHLDDLGTSAAGTALSSSQMARLRGSAALERHERPFRAQRTSVLVDVLCHGSNASVRPALASSGSALCGPRDAADWPWLGFACCRGRTNRLSFGRPTDDRQDNLRLCGRNDALTRGIWVVSDPGGSVAPMQIEAVLGELTEGELLDHADAVRQLQKRCELQVVRIAYEHAVRHNEDTLDPAEARLPGRERAIRYGGDGTPKVTEFAAGTLGARLEMTTYAAKQLMADVLDLAHRLPQLWARVQSFEVRASYARHVANRTRELTKAQARYVDERVVEVADGRIPWSRYEALVDGAIVASDPEAAAAREREREQAVFANPTQSTEDGIRGFYIRGQFHIIALLDARVQWFADLLERFGDTDSNDRSRSWPIRRRRSH